MKDKYKITSIPFFIKNKGKRVSKTNQENGNWINHNNTSPVLIGEEREIPGKRSIKGVIRDINKQEIEIAPLVIKNEIIEKLDKLIKKYNLQKSNNKINIRNKNFSEEVISNNIIEYYDMMLYSFIQLHNIHKDVYIKCKYFIKIRRHEII